MKRLEFKRIGFLIGVTLLFAIGMQAWRIVSQFEVIQTQLQSDIQESLDNAVENYYAELAKTDVVALTDLSMPENFNRLDSLKNPKQITHIKIDRIDSAGDFLERVTKNKMLFETLENSEGRGFDSLFWSELVTDSSSSMVILDSSKRIAVDKKNDLKIFFGKSQADSINQLKFLTSKIIISITRDSLDFERINRFLFDELARRKIDIDYRLLHLVGNPKADSTLLASTEKMPFQTVSRSTFLPAGQSLMMYFENTAATILRRGLVEILTSLLFLSIIIYAFYYLYQTIKNQKEIAEIKQDLISNITHEFKTPIATTLSAIEGIEQFNPGNDPEKTKRYLGISKVQMHKLNQMVEKILETATLDTDQLVLKKEAIDPEPLLRQLVQKFQTLAPEKKIDLILPAHLKPIHADPFHFENALSNLLDNAVKYGGNEIRICLDQNGLNKIRIHDNGGNISLEQKERVFEQFYRIPKGDVHDVKGFGIGLYYVQKILEKHEGKIELETGKNSTTFITYWP
ncbi:two-component system phosphate regulon sensor histidine kinase PhoR [Algoriphagus boseongensis]|uniref:histidine kinase n=1 Tax=Algoriphagus boseongensis TaxID=1442587 RepID=A0A4R6T2I6_9BACT|nr:HAMP domain-containing sensor histidine kinase [Algoriphagus boseongensis]TDQ16354.1 two-component system phosphate regulon sensor histidine kinase PhoR [Algoriphagus boseongensis]